MLCTPHITSQTGKSVCRCTQVLPLFCNHPNNHYHTAVWHVHAMKGVLETFSNDIFYQCGPTKLFSSFGAWYVGMCSKFERKSFRGKYDSQSFLCTYWDYCISFNATCEVLIRIKTKTGSFTEMTAETHIWSQDGQWHTLMKVKQGVFRLVSLSLFCLGGQFWRTKCCEIHLNWVRCDQGIVERTCTHALHQHCHPIAVQIM